MVKNSPAKQETWVWSLGWEDPVEKEMATHSRILASFVKDKVSICVWIYLWAFYFVPLTYISVFVPVPYCLDDCGFVVEPEVRQLNSSSSIFFLKIALASRGFLYFHKNLEIVDSNSVKNIAGSLIGIALNS